MTLQHLQQAITECDRGQLVFNLRESRAFLYRKRWYPLRAIINRAASFANERSDLTTDEALVKLVFLGEWVRIEKVNFENTFPVDIAEGEVVEETRTLSKTLYTLTN